VTTRTVVAVALMVAALAGFTTWALLDRGESCDSWHARYTASIEAIVDSSGEDRDAAIRNNMTVHDERPEGCQL